MYEITEAALDSLLEESTKDGSNNINLLPVCLDFIVLRVNLIVFFFW